MVGCLDLLFQQVQLSIKGGNVVGRRSFPIGAQQLFRGELLNFGGGIDICRTFAKLMEE